MRELDRPDGRTAFGTLLRDQRVAAGLTQEQLAERAGLSVRGLRYLERGARVPYRVTVSRVADALGLSAEGNQELLTAAATRGTPRRQTVAVGVVPVPPDPLIGRDQQVVALVELLTDPTVRLVTLTGPGGVGKTRLAQQVAAGQNPGFPGGVIWVPLAALTDAALVPSAIAQAVGVTQTGALPPLVAAQMSLRDRRVLLLLDNFEHLLAACTVVSDLVASCQQLTVLITSRAALRVRGEHEFAVPPLPAPAATSQTSVYAVASNPAVDLFLRRAQAVRPDFTLTSGNAAVVAAICRRLDGLPLALELAAARIRVVPPPQMLHRLEHRLGFLTAGAPDAPARQHTMRSAIAWSYDLLPAPDQALFRLLAVFHGGCDLPAIRAVFTGADSEGDGGESDLVDGIEELARSSLLEQRDGEEQDLRFWMLYTIREYGSELLAASGEEPGMRGRHAQYYLRFAEQAARGYYSADTARWVKRVERDHDNLRAALRWCIEDGNAEMGLRLGGALWWFWYIRGYATDGRAMLALLLDLPRADAQPGPRAEALLGAGQLALTQGDYAAARAFLQRSVTLYREVGDQRGIAGAMLGGGFAARVQEDYDTASALLRQALKLSRATSNTFITAAALHHLGMIATDIRHDQRAARRLLEGSLTLYRALGFDRFIAQVLLTQADLALTEEQLPDARRLLLEALTTMRGVGETLGIHGALDSTARLAASEGRPELAVQLAAAADRLRTTNGTQSWPITQRRRAQWLSHASDALGAASFHRAWAHGAAMPHEQAITNALNVLTPKPTRAPPN